jgi:AcrR family transcriptional regulator
MCRVVVTRAALARHAGVDPNLIRYYFEDRDSLLLAVIEEIMRAGRTRRSCWRPGRQARRQQITRSASPIRSCNFS